MECLQKASVKMIDDEEAAKGFCKDVCKYEVGTRLYKDLLEQWGGSEIESESFGCSNGGEEDQIRKVNEEITTRGVANHGLAIAK